MLDEDMAAAKKMWLELFTAWQLQNAVNNNLEEIKNGS